MKKIEFLFLGMIAALGSLVIIVTAVVTVQIFLPKGQETAIEAYLHLPAFIIFAVIAEEFFKYLFISKKLAAHKAGRSLIVNAVFFGSGFALAEILFISLNNYPLENAYRNILEIATVHISTSIIIAWPFLTSSSRKFLKISLALLGATSAHLSYNLLSLGEMDFLSSLLSALLFLLILTAILKAKRLGKFLA